MPNPQSLPPLKTTRERLFEVENAIALAQEGRSFQYQQRGHQSQDIAALYAERDRLLRQLAREESGNRFGGLNYKLADLSGGTEGER